MTELEINYKCIFISDRIYLTIYRKINEGLRYTRTRNYISNNWNYIKRHCCPWIGIPLNLIKWDGRKKMRNLTLSTRWKYLRKSKYWNNRVYQFSNICFICFCTFYTLYLICKFYKINLIHKEYFMIVKI